MIIVVFFLLLISATRKMFCRFIAKNIVYLNIEMNKLSVNV